MITKAQAIHQVQHKLGDEECAIWQRSEIEGWVGEGYDDLCTQTQCLFDMLMFDSQPKCANYTREWEREYMYGIIIHGRFGFTRQFERDYVDANAPGPVDHTNPSDAPYVYNSAGSAAPSPQELGQLPEDLVQVARVTHDKMKIDPEWSRAIRLSRNEYMTEQGGVFCYSLDQDGVFSLRRVGVPAPVVSEETITGKYGFIRRITSYGMDSETVIGNYGIIRQLPRHFATGYQYGMLRRVVEDTDQTRVEYFRLGRDLDGHGFEVSDRAVKYIEWYAMARALAKPGAGQDMKLSQHFDARYKIGLQRMKNRVATIMRERTIALGNKRASVRDAYLERLPGDYGYPRPFRS